MALPSHRSDQALCCWLEVRITGPRSPCTFTSHLMSPVLESDVCRHRILYPFLVNNMPRRGKSEHIINLRQTYYFAPSLILFPTAAYVFRWRYWYYRVIFNHEWSVTMFATGKVTTERWTCAREGFVLLTTTNLSATLREPSLPSELWKGFAVERIKLKEKVGTIIIGLYLCKC